MIFYGKFNFEARGIERKKIIIDHINRIDSGLLIQMKAMATNKIRCTLNNECSFNNVLSVLLQEKDIERILYYFSMFYHYGIKR